MNNRFRISGFLLFGVIVFGTAFICPSEGGQLSVSVREPSGTDRLNWPVQGGVPFAKGALKVSDPVALFDASGKPVPLQTATLTKWWDDGSVKWLLLDFFGDVPAGGKSVYTLRYGADAKPAKVESPLRAVKTDEGVEIDTGALRAVIGPRFIHSLSVRDESGEWKNLISSPGELWMTANGQNEGRYASSLDKAATVEIEEQGPNRVCVLVKGTHTAADGRTFGRYILRVHAYAGKPWLRVFHSFINTDFPERGLITGIGMRVPFEYDSGSTVSYGGLMEEAKGGWPGWIEEVDGDKQVVIHDGQHRDLDGRLRAYLAVSTDAGALACFGRQWRQLYPKKMDIAANGLTVWYWPSSLGPFDLRREEQMQSEKWLEYKERNPKGYRQWHHPGTVRSAGLTMRRYYAGLERRNMRMLAASSALGLSRTHETLFVFAPGALETQDMNAMSDAFEDPLLPYPSARYMDSTAVLGHFGWKDVEGFPLAENYLDLKLDWLIRHQNEWARWWGILDWGGLQSQYETLHGVTFPGEWHDMAGRHGWHNSEVDIPQSILFAYLRSGDTRVWRFFDSILRHQMDVDTIHANPPEFNAPDHEWERNEWAKGGQHRHSYNHYSGGANYGHSWNEGLANYYYLTGDRRAREVALEVGEYMYGAPVGKVETLFENRASQKRIKSRYDRSSSNCYRTMLKTYELTGDALWGEEAGKWREHFLKGCPKYLEKDVKMPTAHINHYLVQTLLVDYYLTGDERVADEITQIARWNCDFIENKETGRALHYPFLACGLAWRFTRDDEFLRLPWHAYLSEWQSPVDRSEKPDDFTKMWLYEYYQMPFFIRSCQEAGYSEANPPEPFETDIGFKPLGR